MLNGTVTSDAPPVKVTVAVPEDPPVAGAEIRNVIVPLPESDDDP